jgi:hypothetical protein
VRRHGRKSIRTSQPASQRVERLMAAHQNQNQNQTPPLPRRQPNHPTESEKKRLLSVSMRGSPTLTPPIYTQRVSTKRGGEGVALETRRKSAHLTSPHKEIQFRLIILVIALRTLPSSLLAFPNWLLKIRLFIQDESKFVSIPEKTVADNVKRYVLCWCLVIKICLNATN